LQIDTSILKFGGVLGVEAQVKDVDSGKFIAVGRHTMMFISESMGTVKKFFADQGFGFITPGHCGGDVLVLRAIHGDGQDRAVFLVEGAAVTFDVEWDDWTGKYACSWCSGFQTGGAAQETVKGPLAVAADDPDEAGTDAGAGEVNAAPAAVPAAAPVAAWIPAPAIVSLPLLPTHRGGKAVRSPSSVSVGCLRGWR